MNEHHVDIVKKIISEIGFPSITSTSLSAYKAAVLVVLHSGDPALLDEATAFLRSAPPSSIDKKDLAYITDRRRILLNLPQLYGTQYRVHNGKVHFIEIEDAEQLDSRRKELGLETFDEYKRKAENP